MFGGLKLMRIRGIEVRLDWTLFLIGAFISFSLATGYFPAILPDWGGVAYLTLGLLSCIGLFASVLVHELAHAFMARRYGLQVDRIILNLFGGITNLKDEPRQPKNEFWIAVIGPLASLSLSGTFFLISLLTATLNPALGAVTSYLAVINFVLFAFNMIPAYPLDGGRILKSMLWKSSGNAIKATRWAANTGRFIGWGIIGLGVMAIFSGLLFDGLWLVLIGWLISSAARVSYSQTLASVSLEGLTVGQVIWQGGPAAHPQMKLSEARPLFMQIGPGKVLPVTEQGYLVGVVNPEELRKYNRNSWAEMSLRDVMQFRGSLLAFKPQDDLKQSLETMATKPAFYAAVIGEGGQFAGMLYLADVPRFLQMQQTLGLIGPDGSTSADRGETANLDKAA